MTRIFGLIVAGGLLVASASTADAQVSVTFGNPYTGQGVTLGQPNYGYGGYYGAPGYNGYYGASGYSSYYPSSRYYSAPGTTYYGSQYANPGYYRGYNLYNGWNNGYGTSRGVYLQSPVGTYRLR